MIGFYQSFVSIPRLSVVVGGFEKKRLQTYQQVVQAKCKVDASTMQSRSETVKVIRINQESVQSCWDDRWMPFLSSISRDPLTCTGGCLYACMYMLCLHALYVSCL